MERKKQGVRKGEIKVKERKGKKEKDINKQKRKMKKT